MREFIIRNKYIELDFYPMRNRFIYHRKPGDYYYYNKLMNFKANSSSSITLKIKRVL